MKKSSRQKICQYVTFDKFNNVYKVRHKNLAGRCKIFTKYESACAFVVKSFEIADQRMGAVQSATELLRKMSYVYGLNSPLVPADLNDAVARHLCDADVFRDEVGAEVLSIMLKYQPIRIAFSTALRSTRRPTNPEMRAQRLWRCLCSAVLEISKSGPQWFAKLLCDAVC